MVLLQSLDLFSGQKPLLLLVVVHEDLTEPPDGVDVNGGSNFHVGLPRCFAFPIHPRPHQPQESFEARETPGLLLRLGSQSPELLPSLTSMQIHPGGKRLGHPQLLRIQQNTNVPGGRDFRHETRAVAPAQPAPRRRPCHLEAHLVLRRHGGMHSPRPDPCAHEDLCDPRRADVRGAADGAAGGDSEPSLPAADDLVRLVSQCVQVGRSI
mmetsp:Transcript_71383/g.190262  ORF Transcript_71383/g.190262 Transcript_71383/m.190262 type:complete len:210 (-) Transcript_71383:2079-2708(-)